MDYLYKQLVVLGYFLRVLHSQKDDYDYCNTLRVKIIPLIRLLAPERVSKWVKEKKDYIWKSKRLEQRIIAEVGVTFEVLKQRLEKEGLLDAPGVGEACLSLESILKFMPEDGKVWVMPAQYIIAVQRLKNFCEVINQLKRKDLIGGYLDQSVWDSDIYWGSDICFNKQSFVPSYFQLCEIDESFQNSASMAWDKLYSIEWGWPIDRRDYFRKKKLHYNSNKAADRSRKLFNTNGYWYEVKAIKERRKSIVLTREKLSWYVHLVISVIDAKCIGLIADDVLCLPEAIRLSLENDLELKLIVQWTEGLCEVKHLHTFHNFDNNVRYDFLKSMLQNPQEIIKIDPVSGAKATKYLRDIGLYGVLDTFFVASKRGDKAALISDQINLEDQPETVICDLQNHIEMIETLEWRKRIT